MNILAADTLVRHELRIDREEDVLIVRRKVKSLAQERKFDTFACAALTTAASELTRNVWVHGGGGIAIVEEVTESGRFGIRIVFRDEGPGIEDVERVLKGGYSTARSMGLGLSGSRRLVDDFAIESVVGKGTIITIAKWKRF